MGRRRRAERLGRDHIIENGGNYGWRCYEGHDPYNLNGCGPAGDHEFPLAVYSHSLGAAVTGGYVYHGARIPPLRGVYLYGDYSSGRLWIIDADHEPTRTCCSIRPA